jgi:hypothetical protein
MWILAKALIGVTLGTAAGFGYSKFMGYTGNA